MTVKTQAPARTRHYTSPTRKAGAEATRRAVLMAAREVFTTAGYSASTIEAVATAASVSVPTVYAVFGSKAGLLSALVGDAGSDLDIRAIANTALAETTPARRIAAAAKVVRTIMQREQPILGVLREAGSGSAELEAARRQVHEQQRAALGRVVKPLGDAGKLRAGQTTADATATFAALASPECYASFVEELGWSAARWERWLADAAIRLLLD